MLLETIKFNAGMHFKASRSTWPSTHQGDESGSKNKTPSNRWAFPYIRRINPTTSNTPLVFFPFRLDYDICALLPLVELETSPRQCPYHH